MCIRDSFRADQGAALLTGVHGLHRERGAGRVLAFSQPEPCLLYTSDAADDLLCVDLGGRRIIKKKNKSTIQAANRKRAQNTNCRNKVIQKHDTISEKCDTYAS